jgi:hypothetical protein
VDAPTKELLSWIDERPRSYADTMDAWHSHCPRLLVWEDALADGLVRVTRGAVVVTAAGRASLAGRRDELAVVAAVDDLPQ